MHSATAEQKTRFQRYKYVLVPAVLLLGALVHVGWLARFPTDPLGPVDAEGFHLLAVNMLNGDGFAIGWEPPFCPTAIRPPLYPFLIAGCYKLLGPNPQLIVLGQILLETLTTALVIRLTSSITGLRIGLLAGLLYAINGTTQRYTGYLFAETLLLTLITASLWRTVVCLRRPALGNTALAGFLWGLTLLTKPNVQYLVLAMGGLLIFQNLLGALRFLKCVAPDFCYRWGGRPHGNASPKSAFRPQLIAPTPRPRGRSSYPFVFFLTLLLTVSPWIIRNHIILDRWVFSTAFEENIARVSAVATFAEVNDIDALPWTSTWEYIYQEIVSRTAYHYHWPVADSDTSCAVLRLHNQQIASVAREIVMQHKWSYARAHLWGVLLSLLDLSHRIWYQVLFDKSWDTTGTLDTIWPRIAWALDQNALGDAFHAVWLERVARLPLDAALVWWGLLSARLSLWYLNIRGAWRLRHLPCIALCLIGCVTYLLLLPGSIAHDRFYLPAIPAVVTLAAVGAGSLFPSRNVEPES